jgi:hypothetical protein
VATLVSLRAEYLLAVAPEEYLEERDAGITQCRIQNFRVIEGKMVSIGHVGTIANRHSVFLKRANNLERWAVTRVWEFLESASADHVERAARLLVAHHDGLRMQVCLDGGRLTEFLADVEDVRPFERVILPNLESDEDVQRFVEANIWSIVDAFAFPGELFKIVFFEGGQSDAHPLLAFVIHHLLVDAWSWQVMLSDFFTLHEQLAAGFEPQLPAKTMPLASLAETSKAHWLTRREWADGHWLSLAWHRVEPIPLPPEADLTQNTDDHSICLTRVLPKPEVGRRSDTTCRYRDAELVLAAATRAYCRWTGQSHLLVALAVHGREPFQRNVDLTRTVGWLTELVPILLTDGADEELLRETRKQLYVSQSIARSYGILRYLSSEEPNPYQNLPEPQISLNVKINSYRGTRTTRACASKHFRTRIADRSLYQKDVERPYLLSGGLVARGDEVHLSWDFSAKMLRPAEVKAFLDDCINEYVRLTHARSSSS